MRKVAYGLTATTLAAACLLTTTAHAASRPNGTVVSWSFNNTTVQDGLAPSMYNIPSGMVPQAGLATIVGYSRAPTQSSVLLLDGVPSSKDDTKYVSFPFTTGNFPNGDIILNNAGYGLTNDNEPVNNSMKHELVLYYFASGTTHSLGSPVSYADFKAVISDYSQYLFVNNQEWPLQDTEKSAEQGSLPAFKKPVVLAPNHDYEIRAYITSDTGSGLIDDVVLRTSAVEVEFGAAPTLNIPASGGTTTETVYDNDKIYNLPIASLDPSTYTLELISAEPGLTLNSDGTITSTAGQAGSKSLTYKLCPKYNTQIASDKSEACQENTVTVTLAGAPPVGTATPVPTLSTWALLGLSSLLAIFGVTRTRRRQA